MINSIILSGEGLTDVGESASGAPISQDDDILTGPMLKIVYRLIHDYSPDWYRELHDWTSPTPIPTILVSRTERARISKTLQPNLFQTHTSGRGGIEHSKSAWTLATIAAERGATLAIYFHDTDGTRSVLKRTPNLQGIIEEATIRGFTVASSVAGVPMIPKPTSEAWFICHAKEHPYNYCHLLETQLAGNQESEDRHPKDVLDKLIGRTHRELLNDIVDAIDLERLDMPSFNTFKENMRQALGRIFGQQF